MYTQMFANIDDDDLEQLCKSEPYHQELRGTNGFTSVSMSLHNARIRRIQSEILNYILHVNYKPLYEESAEWRAPILAELDRWKAQAQQFSDQAGSGYTSYEGFSMIYYYSLLMLYRPNLENVSGKAGDWAVQASCYAILSFRKFQANRQIAQPWLGVSSLIQMMSHNPNLRSFLCSFKQESHSSTASGRLLLNSE